MIITKAQAVLLAAERVAQLPNQVDLTLQSNAKNGVIGCVFNYGPGVPGPAKTSFAAKLVDAGWQVVDDAPNTTVTIT